MSRSLYHENFFSSSVNVDINEVYKGAVDGEPFSIIYPTIDKEVLEEYDCADEEEFDHSYRFTWEKSFFPINDNFWPVDILDQDPQEIADNLWGRVTLLEFREQWYFTMSGAGYDKTWEMCYAYIQAEQHPPLKLLQELGASASPATDVERVVLSSMRDSVALMERKLENLRENQQRLASYYFPEEPSMKAPSNMPSYKR